MFTDSMITVSLSSIYSCTKSPLSLSQISLPLLSSLSSPSLSHLIFIPLSCISLSLTLTSYLSQTHLALECFSTLTSFTIFSFSHPLFSPSSFSRTHLFYIPPSHSHSVSLHRHILLCFSLSFIQISSSSIFLSLTQFLPPSIFTHSFPFYHFSRSLSHFPALPLPVFCFFLCQFLTISLSSSIALHNIFSLSIFISFCHSFSSVSLSSYDLSILLLLFSFSSPSFILSLL